MDFRVSFLIMKDHDFTIAATCKFYQCLVSIRKFVTITATATSVSAFILSTFDSYNSQLFGFVQDDLNEFKTMQQKTHKI